MFLHLTVRKMTSSNISSLKRPHQEESWEIPLNQECSIHEPSGELWHKANKLARNLLTVHTVQQLVRHFQSCCLP